MSFDLIPAADGYGGGGGGGGKPDPRVCGDKLCSEIPGGRTAWEDMNKQQYSLSGDVIPKKEIKFHTPKKQTDSDVLPNEVKCSIGLELILKSTDGLPACVKPLTVEKLIERGWAKS